MKLEAKLNKVDLEIRQKVNEDTYDHKVHKKERSIIQKDINGKEYVQYKKLNQTNEEFIVDAEQSFENYSENYEKGLLIDRST